MKAAGLAEGPQGQTEHFGPGAGKEICTSLLCLVFFMCMHVRMCARVCRDPRVYEAAGADARGCARGCRGQRSSSHAIPQEPTTLLIGGGLLLAWD